MPTGPTEVARADKPSPETDNVIIDSSEEVHAGIPSTTVGFPNWSSGLMTRRRERPAFKRFTELLVFIQTPKCILIKYERYLRSQGAQVNNHHLKLRTWLYTILPRQP